MSGRILIACEESQAVCIEFRRLGHEAYSCDTLPCSGGHPEWHIQGDVLKQLNKGWDLMIAHPPCTYLSNSGVRWLTYKDNEGRGCINKERRLEMERGASFFRRLLDAHIPKIAVENPIIHKYAVQIIGRRQDQIIQPWQYGHGETKATCLWLKGLPKLVPTDMVKGREQRIWKMAPGPERTKLRSKTYPGIAKAMAEQWSKALLLGDLH